MIKGYVDNKLFIKSNNINKIKFALEQEVAHNGATSASIFYPNAIFNQFNLINGSWAQAQ